MGCLLSGLGVRVGGSEGWERDALHVWRAHRRHRRQARRRARDGSPEFLQIMVQFSSEWSYQETSRFWDQIRLFLSSAWEWGRSRLGSRRALLAWSACTEGVSHHRLTHSSITLTMSSSAPTPAPTGAPKGRHGKKPSMSSEEVAEALSKLGQSTPQLRTPPPVSLPVPSPSQTSSPGFRVNASSSVHTVGDALQF